VIGPFLGGYLIAWHVPTQYLFWLAAVPLAIGLINAILLTPLYRAEWQGQTGPLRAQAAAGDD
jgi:MFS family permease